MSPAVAFPASSCQQAQRSGLCPPTRRSSTQNTGLASQGQVPPEAGGSSPQGLPIARRQVPEQDREARRACGHRRHSTSNSRRPAPQPRPGRCGILQPTDPHTPLPTEDLQASPPRPLEARGTEGRANHRPLPPKADPAQGRLQWMAASSRPGRLLFLLQGERSEENWILSQPWPHSCRKGREV